MRNALAVVVLCLALASAARAEECEPTPNPNTGQQPTQPDPTPLPEGPQPQDPGATRQPDPGDSPFIVLPPGFFDSTWDPPLAPYAAGGDHSALQNLEGDTHTQYLNRSGSKPLTGDLGLGMASVFSSVDHRMTSGLWFQWPLPKKPPEKRTEDGYMTERGLDLGSAAGHVIQPYVTGTTIVEDDLDPADEEDFGHPPVFEQDEAEGSDGMLNGTRVTASKLTAGIGSKYLYMYFEDSKSVSFMTSSDFGSTPLGEACDPSSLSADTYCSEFRSLDFMSTGIVRVDPVFPTSPRGDFHLGNTSPSIDACSTGSAPDLDGVSRPQFSSIDFQSSGEGISPVATGAAIAASSSDTKGSAGGNQPWPLVSPSGTKTVNTWFRDRFGNDTREPLSTTATQAPSDTLPSGLFESQGVGLRHKYTYRVFMSVTPSPLQVVEDALLPADKRRERFEKALQGSKAKQVLASSIMDPLGALSGLGLSHIDLDRAEGTVLRRLRERNILDQPSK